MGPPVRAGTPGVTSVGSGLRIWVWGLGFWVWGLELANGVVGLGSECGVWGSRCGVWVWGLGFEVWGL